MIIYLFIFYSVLLDHGIDIDMETTNGTALHEAALAGKSEVVSLLINVSMQLVWSLKLACCGLLPPLWSHHFIITGLWQEKDSIMCSANNYDIIIIKYFDCEQLHQTILSNSKSVQLFEIFLFWFVVLVHVACLLNSWFVSYSCIVGNTKGLSWLGGILQVVLKHVISV